MYLRNAQPLDPLAMPLHGWHAIEASAGTGKTYVLVHLVMRLLLEEDVALDQILVLTFTQAATEELRARIARRLREARAAFATGVQPDDALLAALVARTPRARGLAALDAALARLDTAPIRTLHGFGAHILSEYAFETGVACAATPIGDDDEWRALAVADYWRQCLAQADRDTAAWLLAHWPEGPDSLLATLGRWLGADVPRVLPADDPTLTQALAAAQAQWTAFRARWLAERATVAAALRDPALNRNLYRETTIVAVLVAVDQLVAAGNLPRHLPDKWEWLTPAKLRSATKKGQRTPEHPLFEQCAAWVPDPFAALDRRRRAAWLRDARTAIQSRLRRFKHERQWLAFDDLLGQVAAALAGPDGAALAARLRQRWPRALIDECQDADPLQYRIFQRIYGSAPAADIGLILIGDPKQAIYGFRGGDLFAYLAARREVAALGQCWTLNVNWRSSPRLIAALDALFAAHPRPFWFEELTFPPVAPAPGRERAPLLLDGAPVVPLEIRWLPSAGRAAAGETPAFPASARGVELSGEEARRLAAQDGAARIAEWIALGRAGRARLGERPLAPGDIAVLVRTHDDGARMRAALRAQGIPSITLEHTSVLATDEARELAVLLRALREGAPVTAIRAALATRLLGRDAAAIAALDDDEDGWEQLLARYDRYRRHWRERGFLVAFWQLFHDEGIGARLCRLPDGARRLTNVLHLAELLHVVARAHPGSDALLQWLARTNPAGSDADERLVRLESDADAVHILTLHKSKGLEFPLVFMPFPWVGGRAPSKNEPLLFHDADGQACLDLGSAERAAHEQRNAHERLAEDLRLLYVGLTRAAQYCALHWGPIRDTDASALALLLHPPSSRALVENRKQEAGMSDDHSAISYLLDTTSSLDALVARAPGALRVVEACAAVVPPSSPAAVAPSQGGARPFSGRIRDDWRLHSFTSLTEAAAPHWGERERLERDEGYAEIARVDGADVRVPDGEDTLVPELPRGLRMGRCLHDLLERIDCADRDATRLRDAAARSLARHGLGTEWATATSALLTDVLDTPFTPTGDCLRAVPRTERLSEFSFHFALRDTHWPALARYLRAQDYVVPELSAARGRGLMKGAIDLVFRCADRYYLVDYKSNDLGARRTDYAAARLPMAMDANHYRLQYLIYTVALHRYLRRRLVEYDYDRHIGGVYYLFLRGMRPADGATHGVFFARPSAALIAALDQKFGGPRSSS